MSLLPVCCFFSSVRLTAAMLLWWHTGLITLFPCFETAHDSRVDFKLLCVACGLSVLPQPFVLAPSSPFSLHEGLTLATRDYFLDMSGFPPTPPFDLEPHYSPHQECPSDSLSGPSPVPSLQLQEQLYIL